MKIVRGDIWDHVDEGAIVVTTNIGWTKSGDNPMGRGIALQAKQRTGAALPRWYGSICKDGGANTGVAVWADRRAQLLLFPTKPLNETWPHLSWRNKASLPLIERGLQQLVELVAQKSLRAQCHNVRHVFLPLVGCANGGLCEEEVLPLLHQHLVGDAYTLVLR